MKVEVMTNILDKNDRIAAQINAELGKRKIFVFNLLGSPGSGKTTLLEKTIATLQGELRMAVIEGDLFTSKDADRIGRYGAPVVQINTGGGCHLDAEMVQKALTEIDLDNLDILVIENVGNLVCPAEFSVGEDVKVTVLSITEGEDKPLKYPLIFKQSSAVILNKIDLLPYTSFDMPAATTDLVNINPNVNILPLSCRTGEGLEAWLDWLRTAVQDKKNNV